MTRRRIQVIVIIATFLIIGALICWRNYTFLTPPEAIKSPNPPSYALSDSSGVIIFGLGKSNYVRLGPSESQTVSELLRKSAPLPTAVTCVDVHDRGRIIHIDLPQLLPGEGFANYSVSNGTLIILMHEQD